MLAFSMLGFASLYAILRTQAWLPWNPQGFDNLPPDLAFKTAISFLTNTRTALQTAARNGPSKPSSKPVRCLAPAKPHGTPASARG